MNNDSRNTETKETSAGYGAVLRTAAVEVAAGLDSPRLAQAAERAALAERELTPDGVANALAGCHLQVRRIPWQRVVTWVGPGQVALGVGDGELTVLAHDSQRRVRQSVVTTFDVQRSLPRRRQLRGMGAARDTEWLAVSMGRSLDDMASPNTPLTPWRRLWRFARIERRDLGVIALFAATLGLLTLVTPIATQSLVNTIAFGTVLQPLVVLTVALALALGLAGTLAALQAYVVEVLQRRILVRLAEDLSERLPQVRPDVRDRIDLVELNNRFFDVITVQKTAAELLLGGLGLALQTVLGLVLLAFYHPILLAFALVLVLALLGVIALGRGGTATAVYESKAKFAIAAWLDELARNPHLFAAGHGRGLGSERSALRIHEYVRRRRVHYRHVLAVLVGGISMQAISIVALLAVGGYLVIERQLTLGQLVAAELVVGAIAVGFGKLGHLADKAFDLVVATDKLGHLLDLPLRDPGRDALPQREPGLEVTADAIEVRTPSVRVAATSFHLRAGEKCIVQGEGAELALEALAGQRPIAAGRLSWDGHSQPRMDDLAGAVLLLDDGSVVAGTVMDNLRLGNLELGEEDAWRALETVGLARACEECGGLQRAVLPTGGSLTRGERRRLLLARALIARPRLLLLDRVLDFLAADDDLELATRVLGTAAPWTAVIVSDDPRIKALAQRVLTLSASMTERGVA